MSRTVVHLVRHGEVHNPDKVLYGRLPHFRLSELGQEMAQRIREHFTGTLGASAQAPDGHHSAHDIAQVVASPMQRAQETAAPLALALGYPIAIEDDLIEASNVFEGQRVTGEGSVLKRVSSWRYFVNPFRPSWGEPYVEIAARMRTALDTARLAHPGRESVLVSHQLPIWIARLDAEHRRLVHDPRKRECALASVTSFHYEGDVLSHVSYAEPAADLAARATKVPGA